MPPNTLFFDTPARQHDARLFRVRAVKEQRASDDLRERRARFASELRTELGERRGRVAAGPHFHELVLGERAVERLHDPGRSALIADLDDGFSVMRERTQVAALPAVELGRRDGR